MRLLLTALCVVAVVGLAIFYVKVPASVTLPSAQPGKPPRFPSMRVKNLSDEVRRLPADFPAEKTLLLIAFHREQQDDLDDWSARMNLRRPGAPAWLELPVIDDPGALLRWFVDVGMKNGISESSVRDRVFSVYAPRESFIHHLGLPGTDQVHLVVVDRTGGILCSVSGEWTAAKESILLNTLK